MHHLINNESIELCISYTIFALESSASEAISLEWCTWNHPNHCELLIKINIMQLECNESLRMNHEKWINNHELQAMSHELRIRSYKLGVMSHALHDSWFMKCDSWIVAWSPWLAKEINSDSCKTSAMFDWCITNQRLWIIKFDTASWKSIIFVCCNLWCNCSLESLLTYTNHDYIQSNPMISDWICVSR